MKNNDILPAVLDLPNHRVSPLQMERHLKLWALFFDRIIIPDGWIHCYGPISEYLRRHLKTAEQGRRQFHSNTFLRLLEAEVIVPALRGERPTRSDRIVRGYKQFDVARGKEKSRDVKRLNFGVQPGRMMIMDLDGPETVRNSQNAQILEAVQNSTRLFAAWSAPALPVTALDCEDQKHVRSGDSKLGQRVALELLDEDLQTELLDSLCNRTRLQRKELQRFAEPFYKELGSQCGPEGIRRGDLENVVARQIFGGRMDRYAILDDLRHEPTAHKLVDEFASGLSGRTIIISPRREMARFALEITTTIQEASFADRFQCSLSIPPFFNDAVYHREAAREYRLARDTEAPDPGEHTLLNTPIPFECIGVDEVLELRRWAKEEGFLQAQAQCRTGRDFVADNHHYISLLREYLRRCNEAAVFRHATRVVEAAIRLVLRVSGIEVAADAEAITKWAFGEVEEEITERLEHRLGRGILRPVLKHCRDSRLLSTYHMLGIDRQIRCRNDRRIAE